MTRAEKIFKYGVEGYPNEMIVSQMTAQDYLEDMEKMAWETWWGLAETLYEHQKSLTGVSRLSYELMHREAFNKWWNEEITV